MYKVLIKNYIANLSPIQVKQFALSKNVELTEEEANYFTSFVKKNWEILLYQDSSYLFEEVKKHVRSDVYEKALYEYQQAKQKYQSFL